MIDMNKFVIPDGDRSLFHSSGFAQMANGNRLGATARESFEQRRLAERNRQVIGSYQRSGIVGSYSSSFRPKPVLHTESKTVGAPAKLNQISSPVVNRQSYHPAPIRRPFGPFA